VIARPSVAVQSLLWGRDRELDQLWDLVRTIDAGARFLVIRGAAGIGKTALWRWGVDQHRAAGHRVLVTRPAEEELHGPMTGLIDLFEDGDVAPGTLDPDVDVFDRGRAVLRTLRGLAADQPVVVAIDDIQWLDGASARTLRYALRRLDQDPVVLLATERRGTGEPDELDEPVAPPDRREHLDLGPLPADAIRRVVRAVVGTISRPALDRIVELSGGNPMYAIELAHSAGVLADPLGVAAPPTLREALAARLGETPSELLAVLRTAAALGPASAADLARACQQTGASETLILDAITAGLLVVGDDGVVRFAHPLLASGVLDAINPLERRELHARLADVVNDTDARARHLAQSCGEPDESVAAELEAAAERAARRGAAAVAAELARHSYRVTPGDTAEASRRALAEISYRAAAGEIAAATAMVDAFLDRHEPGPPRVEAITQRVYLDIDGGDEFLTRALAESGDDPVLRGRVLDLFGWLLGLYRGQLARGIELSTQALTSAEERGDPVLEMLATGTLSMLSLLAGRPDPTLIERACSIAAVHEGPLLGRWPPIFRAREDLWAGRLAEARAGFEAMREAFGRRGVEFQRPYRLSELAQVEVAAGNLDRAVELAADALEAALDGSNPQAAAWVRYPVGLAHAHRGEQTAARDAAAELRVWGAEHDQPPRTLMAAHVLGVTALAGGDAAAAAAALEPAVALAAELGYRHPGYIPLLPDAVEATALAGQLAGCEQLAAELDAQAAALRLPWVDAAARRAHGLLALATGCDEAAGVLAEAAAGFDALGYRLDAARSALLQGRALRRAGRRSDAAAVLEDTRACFAGMGAAAWVAQAEAEAERVAPSRTAGQLTATESKIADLVAAGRRNREIAGELFVSVATVEAHLTRIYRKFGVHSRTELSRYVHGAR
jgi:DNA-binding CsgD family transcriptional regulator